MTQSSVILASNIYVFILLNRDKDGPVVFVGDDEHQTIEIRATVTNRGSDPSYATSVYTSYPESLLDLNTHARDIVSCFPP